jgi:hypothetical protein
MSVETAEKVKRALWGGASIGQITSGKPAGGGEHNRNLIIASFKIIKRYRQENPEFDRLVIEMTKDNNRRGQMLRRQRERNVLIREQNSDYHQILAMVPRHLSPDMRDDVAQSIFVALLEGSLRRDEVRKRLPEFVTAHNRDVNRYSTGKFGLISIDAPMFAESSTTLADTITRSLWD